MSREGCESKTASLKEVNEMRRGFGVVIGLVITVVLLSVVGAIAYNIGWSTGANVHPVAGAMAPGPWGSYGFHPFFAGFGILWFLLILFGIFWLLRFAFFGRPWGYRHWGYGGWGYGPGPSGMPPGMEQRMEEWHRRAHGEQPPAGTTPPPPPPSDTRSV
jgi:hypothetical protein